MCDEQAAYYITDTSLNTSICTHMQEK